MDENKTLQKRVDKKVIPTDVKLLSWLIIGVSALFLALGLAILSRFFRLVGDDVRMGLFGIWQLDSAFEFGTYHSITGALGVISGIFIFRGSLYGCIILGFLMLDSFVLDIIGLSEFPVSATIGIFLNICIVFWLFYRRDIFVRKDCKLPQNL